jgi:type VI secretion system protein ImpE
MQAESLVKQGLLNEALAALQEQIRAKPEDAKLRVFLFQLLSVRGEWKRAMTQLDVASQLDAKNLLMAQVCRQGIMCEALRAEVFEGKRTPLVLGKPEEWIGWLVQAAQHTARGEHAAAEQLRSRAMEAAPASAGEIWIADPADKLKAALSDARPETAAPRAEAPKGIRHEFEWIADSDSRLGPVVEAIVEGRYYWIPMSRILEIRLEEPADLRDVVWTPASFTWTTGAQQVGLIPTRYPTSEGGIAGERLARETNYDEPAPGVFIGRGQRMWMTDSGEHAIMQTRLIRMSNPKEPSAGDDSKATS